MGSQQGTTSGSAWLYRVSKAALNMAVVAAQPDYPKATFIALCPGWVQTDMGGPQAILSPQDSIKGMRQVIAKLSLKDSGQFLAYDGKVIPW